METNIVKNENGSVHVIGGPLTTAITRQEMPDLLLSDVDSRLVKVRPMATPIDQISRMAPPRKSDSMVVEYYQVDCQPDSTTTASRRWCSMSRRPLPNSVSVRSTTKARSRRFREAPVCYVWDVRPPNSTCRRLSHR